MGEARRRKLLGLGSRQKVEAVTQPKQESTQRLCALCGRAGGTLLRLSTGGFEHIPDCNFAAAVAMRKNDRIDRSLAAYRERIQRARRLALGPPRAETSEEPQVESEPEPETPTT